MYSSTGILYYFVVLFQNYREIHKILAGPTAKAGHVVSCVAHRSSVETTVQQCELPWSGVLYCAGGDPATHTCQTQRWDSTEESLSRLI